MDVQIEAFAITVCTLVGVVKSMDLRMTAILVATSTHGTVQKPSDIDQAVGVVFSHLLGTRRLLLPWAYEVDRR